MAIRLPLALLLAILAAEHAAAQRRTDRFGDPLPAGRCYRIGTARLQLCAGGIQAIAVAPDGKRVAAVGHEVLAVWEVPGGREVCRLLGDQWHVSLAFTADGKSLLCGSEQGLCLRDANTGAIRHRLDAAPNLLTGAIDGATATAVLAPSTAT